MIGSEELGNFLFLESISQIIECGDTLIDLYTMVDIATALLIWERDYFVFETIAEKSSNESK